MSISVTFAYGGILYSYMRNNGWFTGAPWYYDLAGWLMHVLPQIFQVVEWQYSSIPLEYTRIPVYYFINLCYMILNVSFGAQGIQLYESNEWVHG